MSAGRADADLEDWDMEAINDASSVLPTLCCFCFGPGTRGAAILESVMARRAAGPDGGRVLEFCNDCLTARRAANRSGTGGFERGDLVAVCDVLVESAGESFFRDVEGVGVLDIGVFFFALP